VATVTAQASASVQFFGTIANTPVAIRSMLRKLGKGDQKLRPTYEAGPLGYNLYRLSTGLGRRGDVCGAIADPRARSATRPRPIGAMMLRQLLRAGHRRARTSANAPAIDEFLLRHGRTYPDTHSRRTNPLRGKARAFEIEVTGQPQRLD